MRSSKISKALEKAKKERDQLLSNLKESKESQKAAEQPEKRAQKTVSSKREILPQKSIDIDRIDERIVVYYDADSFITEQYRIMRTNLQSLPKKNLQVIGVSSSIEAEGKTLTSINFAHTLAADETKKVLVIDGDFRKGTLQNYFGYKCEDGMKAILEDEAKFEDVVVQSGRKNLHFLFRGEKIENPVDMLGSQKLQDLITDLKSYYDYIIFDCPPIMPITDAAVIGNYVDGMILVIKLGFTQRDIVKGAMELFEQAGTEVIGIVLTNSSYATNYGYKEYYYYKSG